MRAEQLIRQLGLKPHPSEGGYFVETYRSELRLPADVLPDAYDGPRRLSTAIYYLLTPDTHSAMHRVPGDEIFHFYLGDPVEMLQLHPDGRGEVVRLGPDPRAGFRLQHVVPAGVWQGARLRAGGRYALLGTTLAPGFEYQDFEAGDRDELCERFPRHAELITALTFEP